MGSFGKMVRMTVGIAFGSLDDLEAISEIYGHYVRTSAISFDVEVPSAAWRREWFSLFDTRGRHRLLVTRSQGRAVGYAASVPYRPRAAYAPSVETSVYVAPSHTGQGLGSALYRALLAELEREDVHRAYAGIAMPNLASVRLHERCGYRRAGYYSEQGRKFGRYWDVAWYERAFPEVASTTSG
jgi:phosphinothricin acetyltransferase